MLDKGIESPKDSESSGPLTSSRHRILRQLLENKAGWSIDQLAKFLSISRTAAQNHCLALEKEGLIKKNSRVKTLGRPSILYALTDKGTAYFPKKYALFSEVLLKDLQNIMSPDQFIGYMRKLGKKVADQYRPRFGGLNEEERLNALFALMQELGFHADWVKPPEAQVAEIIARNCIFHDLAQKLPEVCAFDQTLMAELADKKVELCSCMAKGDEACCFRMHLDNS